MSFFDTISRIIQQGKEMAVKATPSSTVTYNKVTPVDNSKFQSNPLLQTRSQQTASQPTVFGVPNKGPVIKPLAPKTANTTGQLVTPTKLSAPAIPPPPINPLDIIRRGKEQAIRQGTTDPSALQNQPIAKIPVIGKLLAGTGENNRGLYAPDTLAGSIERQGAVGFLMQGFKNLTNPDRKRIGEQIYSDYETRIKAGEDPETALKVATQNLVNKKTGNLTGVKRSIDDIQNPNIELTTEQALSLMPKNLGRKVMAVLDAPGIGATTKPVKGALQKFAQKTASNMTEADAKLLRNMYVARTSAPDVINEQRMAEALNLDKLPYDEQKQVVKEVLKEYDARWAGVDEVANPPVVPNRPGAMDVKKPNVLDKTVLKKTEPLEVEAKKYKSADDFVKAQIKSKDYTMSHRPTEGVRAFDLTEKVDGEQMIPRDMYSQWYGSRGTIADKESISVLKKIKGNPDAEVTIYRASPSPDFNDGDWVSFSKSYAEEHAQGNGTKVYSKKVLAKDVKWAMDDVNEFGYFPEEPRNQLRQIWEKANLSTSPTDYKSADDFVEGMYKKGYFDNIKGSKARYDEEIKLTDIWKQANAKQKPNKMADYRAGKPNSEGGYIQNPLAGKGETPKSNNQVVSSGNDSIETGNLENLKRIKKDAYDALVKAKQAYKSGGLQNKRALQFEVMKKQDAYNSLTRSIESSQKTVNDFQATQVVPKTVDTPQLSPIDRLIADNKIRVVSRDGRDVYQVKKGDTWVNKRDEDSAIHAVTPRSPIDVTKKTKAPTELRAKPVAPVQPKVRQMSRSRDVAWLEREATDRVLREQKRVEKQLSPAFRSVLDEPTPLNKETVAQLEKAAMPTADVVRPSTPYKAESLANVITKTPLDRKVNIIDYLRTPDRVLNKIGFGKEAKLLRDQYEKYSVELPKNIDKISEWVKRAPDKDASTRIFQYLDGKTVKLSATEKKVADEIRAYLKDWADRLGLPEENRVANYITRLFDDQLIKQEFDEDLAKIISGKIPGEVYNPFLQKRLGAKGYKQDVWGALDAYTKRATRKVHLDPALDRIREKAGSSLDFTQLEESQFKYIQRYIDRVQMRPTEVDNAIDNAVKQTLGYRFGQRPVTTVSRFLRRMTYRGMLGANLGSALRNLSQGVNTYAVLGEKYTAIGYAKLLQPASQRELIEQGIFNNNFIEDRVLSSTKKLLQKGDKALWFFFDRAEKINRGSAYLGAKAKGLGRGMSEQQAIDYAKNIVRKTQFSYDAVDQPVALGSDIMKTMFQFQTYTTKQAEFLTEMVKDKNVVGLLRYAIGGYLFVNTVGKALGMEESELVPLWDTVTGERKFSPAPSLKFPIELTKAIADTPDRYGNDRDLEQKAKDVGKSLIGLIPGGTQIKKTYEGYKASQEGGSFDKAGRKQFEVGDSKASQLQAILFGKYANQNAKDYFNKETNTGNKELDETIKDSKEKEKNRSKDAEAMLVSLKSLPPDRANAVMKELKINDEAMFNKVKALKQAEDLNWSKEEKAIANLGVTDGTKARYVYSQVNKLGTAEEKNAYLKELLDRKIISKEVLKQIKDLKEGGKNNATIE